MSKNRGTVRPVLQARAGLEQEWEGEVIRARGTGAEEGAVEREAVAIHEMTMGAEGERAERGIVGGCRVRRGWEGSEDGKRVEKRAWGGRVGEGKSGDEAVAEGRGGVGGEDAGDEEVRVELQKGAERRRVDGGAAEEDQQAGRRRHRFGQSGGGRPAGIKASQLTKRLAQANRLPVSRPIIHYLHPSRCFFTSGPRPKLGGCDFLKEKY